MTQKKWTGWPGYKKRFGGNDDWQDIIGTMPSITGEQAAVSTPLSNYLAEALAGFGDQPTFEDWLRQQGNVPTMFGGALGGQIQSAFSEALSGEVPNMFGGELGAQAQSAYEQAMSGVAPDVFGGPLGAEAQAAYQGAMSPAGANMFGGELGSQAMSAYAEALSGKPVDYDPSGASFLQNVMPAIKESYVGTGAITGTEVGDRLGREASVRMEQIAGIRASLYDQAKGRQAMAAGNYQQAFQQQDEASKNRALSAAGMYQSAYQSGQEQAKQRQLVASGNYQQAYQSAVQAAKDRQLSGATSLAQYNLEVTKISYDNYVRQNPDAATILQSALNYLNIPLLGVYQKPIEEEEKQLSGAQQARLAAGLPI